MNIMDFKGITWVGNVYQKFEAMCLEVEEIIVQDTVKYVENQVQTVGASVKKFYSDVVEDFVPESSVDSVKLTAAPMFHEYAPVCSFEKSKEATNRNHRTVQRKQLVKDSEVTHDTKKKDLFAPKFHGLPVEDRSFQNFPTGPRPYEYGGTYRKSKLHAKRITRKDNLAQVTAPQVGSCVRKDLNDPSQKVHESSDVRETISSTVHLVEASRFNSTEESRKGNGNGNAGACVPTVLSDAPTTNTVESIKSQGFSDPSQKVHESSHVQETITSTVHSVKASRCNSAEESGKENGDAGECVPTVLSDAPTTNTVESIKSQELVTRLSCSESLSEESKDACMSKEMVSQAGSSAKAEAHQDGFPNNVVSAFHPEWTDEQTADTIEMSSAVEQRKEIILQLSQRPVEESCILVNKDEVRFVRKHKTYKTKIRNAISSRMKSARKQEYEKLALQWFAGEEAGCTQEPLKNPTSVEKTTSPASHSESDWELL